MKITVATGGTKGDFFPYLAIALELDRRGHSITFASSPQYRSIVEKHELVFKDIRPDVNYEDKQLASAIMSSSSGAEYAMKELIDKNIRDTYSDLLSACDGSDLLFSHMVCFAGPIVAQKTGIPWVSGVLAPSVLWSKYDPIIPHNLPFLKHVSAMGPGANGFLIKLIKGVTKSWFKSTANLRKELGLPRGQHPLFEGAHSPELTLGLYSKYFAERKPDYPSSVKLSGFAFLNDDRPPENQHLVQEFLSKGKKPIVFTLGSSAVHSGDDFYAYAQQAAQDLGERAIFLTASEDHAGNTSNSDQFLYLGHYPHNRLFSEARLVVHHGGMGTMSRALEAGCPGLVVPFSHDQPDNAHRLRKLGVAEVLKKRSLSTGLLKNKLRTLLVNKVYHQNAITLMKNIERENGTNNASDLIESFMQQKCR